MIFKEPAYILKDTGISTKENAMHFLNPYRIRVRHDKLIAECLKISRSQAQKLLETGALKVSKLSNDEVNFQIDYVKSPKSGLESVFQNK